jgi:hypothetical protein
MKKNYFWSVCLSAVLTAAILLLCIIVPTAGVISNINVMAAAGKELFKSDGAYNVSKSSIIKGAEFLFFGYKWRVVSVVGNTATFWMSAPYGTDKFTTETTFGDTQNESNTWNNGYYSSTWQGKNLGGSNIRTKLAEKAEQITGSNPAGSDKIIAGPVSGVNEANTAINVSDVYYRKTNSANVTYAGSGQSVTVNYQIGSNDKLWLPSENEIKENGLWNLTSADRSWTYNTDGAYAYAWLRSPFNGGGVNPTDSNPFPANNCDGVLVGYTQTINDITASDQILFNYTNLSYGIRPAIHLDISGLPASSGSGENPDTGGTGNNTGNGADSDNGIDTVGILKIVFIAVCAVGVVAIIWAIAVVHRDRKNALTESY